MYTVYWTYSVEEEYLNDQYQDRYFEFEFYPTFEEGRGEFQISQEDVDTYFDATALNSLLSMGYSMEEALVNMLNGPDWDFTELCDPLLARAEQVEDERS